MKDSESNLKRVIRRRPALCASGAYGVAAILLYALGFLSGGDGPLGAWYLVYFSALPVSWLFNFGAGYLSDLVPDRLGQFLYSASPILAGMVWVYLLSRGVLAAKAIIKRSRRADAAQAPVRHP